MHSSTECFYSVWIITAYDWSKAEAIGWVLNGTGRLLKKLLFKLLNTIYTIHNMLIKMAFKEQKENRYTIFISTYNVDDKIQYKSIFLKFFFAYRI